MTTASEPHAASTEAGSPPALGQHAARGFAWTAGRALVVRAMSLVSFVVLARLLQPSDFGLAALASVFTAFVQAIASAGLAPALVQRPTIDTRDIDSAFWTAAILGLILAGILFVAAWPLAVAYGTPTLRPVLQVLCIPIVVGGFASAHQALLQRRLRFSAVASAGMTANVVATVVGVAFAYRGYGVWAIVVQSVLAPTGTSLACVVLSGYRPGLDVSLSRIRSLFGFSRYVIGTSLTRFFNQRTDDFLIGGFLGTVALGTYTVGYRLLTVMIDVLLTSVQGVIFPVFSRVQTETARLREAYLSATRMAAFITFPTFAFVIVTAPQIIDVAFGSKWQQSVPVMQILCLVGPIWAVAQFNNAVLMATGHARFVFYMNLAGTILQVIGFFIAVRFGILWVAAAYVIRAYVGAPIALVRAARLLDSPFSGYVRELCPATVASVVMVACVMGTQALLDGQVPQALELVVLGGVALGAYMAAMRAASASHFAEAMHYARAVRPRLHGARAA